MCKCKRIPNRQSVCIMDQLPIVIKETNARCSDIGKLMDYLCVILDKFNSDAVENIIGKECKYRKRFAFCNRLHSFPILLQEFFQHWKRQFSNVGLATPHLLLSEYTRRQDKLKRF